MCVMLFNVRGSSRVRAYPISLRSILLILGLLYYHTYTYNAGKVCYTCYVYIVVIFFVCGSFKPGHILNPGKLRNSICIFTGYSIMYGRHTGKCIRMIHVNRYLLRDG